MAKEGRKNHKIELTERFAEAIDRAAMKSGAAGTDAYLDEWRKDMVAAEGELEAIAVAEAERLEAAYTTEIIRELVKNGGHKPE